MRNFATPPIMHIKRHLQFNFSLRFQRKVRFTENRVIGEKPRRICIEIIEKERIYVLEQN